MKSIYILKGLIILLILSIFFTSCEKNSPVNSENTTAPKIISLTADKTEINFGGEDPAIIICSAEGGNLDYEWEVDLGNIITFPNDNSKMRFTASPCCIGKKIIKCTIKNDKGTDSKIIELFIKDPKK